MMTVEVEVINMNEILKFFQVIYTIIKVMKYYSILNKRL